MGLSDVANTIGEIGESITSEITENPFASIAAGAAGVAATGAIVGAVVKAKSKKRKKKTKTSKKKSTKKKSKGRKLKFGSAAYRKKYLGKHRKHTQRKPHTAGKRKDRSTKRIRYTKNNQPYVILANGRARFIKRSSASRSKKLKGGRY